jgi:hypothetical protein
MAPSVTEGVALPSDPKQSIVLSINPIQIFELRNSELLEVRQPERDRG